MNHDAGEQRRDPWRERMEAVRNLPGALNLVWKSAPRLVSGALVLRCSAALIPLGILAVSRRIIDTVNSSGDHAAATSHLWMLLWMEFGLAAASLILARAVDYCDGRLTDEFTHHVSLRVMQQAAVLDLSYFEDAGFYDKLERARVQATDPVAILTAIGSLFQRSVSLISLAAAVIWYSPWLFAFSLSASCRYLRAKIIRFPGLLPRARTHPGAARAGLSSPVGKQPRERQRDQCLRLPNIWSRAIVRFQNRSSSAIGL